KPARSRRDGNASVVPLMGIKRSPGQQMSKISRLRKDAVGGFLRASGRQFFEVNDEDAPDNICCLVAEKSCFRKSDRNCTVSHHRVGIDSFFSESCRKIHGINRRTRALPERIDFTGESLQPDAEFRSGAKPEESIEDNPGAQAR